MTIFSAAPVKASIVLSTASAVVTPPWLDAQESGGVIYFLYTSPALVKRYDTSAENWLPDVSLNDTPISFAAASDAIYIAYSRSIYKYNLDLTEETHLMNTSNDIKSMYISGKLMFMYFPNGFLGGMLISVDLQKGKILKQKSIYFYKLTGLSIAHDNKSLFGRTQDFVFPDIVRISFDIDGLFGEPKGSPYQNQYPDATKTWVSANEKIVIDNAGIVYNTVDLTYRDSLNGVIDDLIFYKDAPVVLRNGKIIAFSKDLVQIGLFEIRNPQTSSWLNIFLCGENIFAVSSKLQVEKIAVSSLNLTDSNMPTDPNGLAYTPDAVVMGANEIVYLMSTRYQSIFRWSVVERKYLSTIALPDMPKTMDFSFSENSLFVGYFDGGIYKIGQNAPFEQTVFAHLSSPVCGITTWDKFVFTCNRKLGELEWPTYSVFSASTGELLSTGTGENYSSEYIWNAAQQKMYFIDDWISRLFYSMGIDANGKIGSQKSSASVSDYSIVHPIRVKPDGSIVLLGSGRIYDATSLVQINTLSNKIVDGNWTGDKLVTIRINGENSELQEWSPGSFGIIRSQVVNGLPNKVLPVAEGWLAITVQQGIPHFTILSNDLAITANAPVCKFFIMSGSGNVPFEAQFLNQSEGIYTSSFWNFGDGGTSTEKNPTHIYTRGGQFTVKLTVRGPSGSDTLIMPFSVQVTPLTAVFVPSITEGPAPLKVFFNNISIGYFEKAFWDFGDGGSSTEISPTHVFLAPGFYTIKLKMDGPYGSHTIKLENYIHPIDLGKNLYMPFATGQ
jgi:PKD repeat protein